MNLNPGVITRRVRATGLPNATSNVYKPGVVLVFLGDGATAQQARTARNALMMAGYDVVARGDYNMFVLSPEV